MPAPADRTGSPGSGPPKTGFPKTGSTQTGSAQTGSTGPESAPRPAGSGPGYQRAKDATLSPYLRRRLRSLAEALSDTAESHWGTTGRSAGERPGPEAASDPEARRQDPPRPGPRAPDQDRRVGPDPATDGAGRQASKSR